MATAFQTPSPSEIPLRGDPPEGDRLVGRSARVSDLQAENTALRGELAETQGELKAARALKDEETERLGCQLKRAWTEQHRLEGILRAIVLDRYERDQVEKCCACEGTGKDLKQVDGLLEGCEHMEAAERVDEFENRFGWHVNPCPESDCFEGNHIPEVSA